MAEHYHRGEEIRVTAPYQPSGAPAGAPNNTLGLVSMILGIAAIPLVCCFYLGLPLGIAAVVLGFMGRQKADQGLATNRGQAQAGFFCGIAAIGFAIILIIINVVVNVSLPGYGV